jgi:AraC-like DNA-binding protein
MQERTSLVVRSADNLAIEIVDGPRTCWSFRPHFHTGDEIVHILDGSARLHLRSGYQHVGSGDTVVVPAGAIHRFEPVDKTGWSFVSEFRPAPVTGDRNGDDSLGARALTLIADRESLLTDVEAIAEACAVSAGYLSRVFRRETGTSLHNFHVLLALHKAKRLLRDGAPLVETAIDAGFYDQAHMSREFVKTFGMTPGTFRAAWMQAA